MTSRQVALGVYTLIVLAGVLLQLNSQRSSSRIPSLGTVFSRVMRTRSGRIGVVAGWAWLGLHFFAR
ncbi:MAG: hypothetical protein E6G44_07890 [Actinobacteria bacterium]|nr:MAG: hypothetical protein E6G44_07890 [Actinomycetota bacterium]